MRLFSSRTWEKGIAILEDDVVSGMFLLKDQHLVFDRKIRSSKVALSVPVRYKTKGKSREREIAEHLESSHNGVRLALGKPVGVGERIEIQMKLPQIIGPFTVRGVVTWVHPSYNSHATWECGVAFGNLKSVSNKEKIVYFLADRMCRFALSHSGHLTVRVADSLEDLQAAYRLVYRQYLGRGYCQANDVEMHCNFFCLLPESRTFLLEKEGRLLGTISLLVDSRCGLPMESLFPGEVANLRSAGAKIAEVGLLALDRETFGEKRFALTDFTKLASSFHLFKIMFDYARFAGVTDLAIAMHPKHKDLYRYMTFEGIGPVRAYPGACGHPALPMHMNIARALSTTPCDHGVGSFFLRHEISREILSKSFSWDAHTLREFLTELLPLWSKMTPEQQLHFLRCYPGLQRSSALAA